MNDIYSTEPTTQTSASQNKRLRVFLYLGLVITVVLAALGAAVVTFSFDSETRYFTFSSISLALAITSAVAVAFAISSFFVFNGAKLEQTHHHIGAALLTRILTIAPISLCAYYTISSLSAATDGGNNKNPQLTAALLFLMFILCAVYNVSRVITLNKTLAVISGIAQIAFCLYIISALYFDLRIEINSPFKLVIQFAAAALAIDTCMEVRDVISGVSTRAYIATKALSIAIGTLAFTITVCAVIQNAKLDDLGYLWYSIYFFAQAICSCIDLSRVKHPTSLMDTPVSDIQPDSQNA